ncbi:hypothetical protein chiPu_0008598 [Chiloscyllium punctatum]|uniref:Uncharacterized protein n=1 Tax=Chiloscyllium punctatum TaxID=137246 RepID=A0A401SIC6_CHIPU|nr:hypothetical protein [Chiloscyllium punctatum]
MEAIPYTWESIVQLQSNLPDYYALASRALTHRHTQPNVVRTKKEQSKNTYRIKDKMAGGSCPEENVPAKQDDPVQIMDGISLKQNCKSHYTEAKGTNKSCENLVTKEIKFQKPHMTGSELNLDRMKTCKRLVEKAVKLKKIFTIYGPYPLIRQSLRNRGWLEKKVPKPLRSPQKKDKIINGENDIDDGVGDSDGCDFDDKQGDDKDNSDEPDNIYNITSRLLKNETTFFLWTNGTDAQNLQKDQIFNHFVGASSFTTKAGLCVNLRNFQWFNGVNPDTFFPRCYRIAVEEEKQSFIEDFRMTAARSILKWVVELKKKSDMPHKGHDWRDKAPRSSVMEAFHRQTQKKGGVVPVQLVETALRACEEYLNTMDHKDIDVSLDTPPAVTERCWEETIQQYYEVIHEGATIQNWKIYAAVCENMLKQLQEVNTQLKMEGMRNIWIVKPGAQSRGRGITCMNRLEQIVKLVYGQTTLITDGKWVVQKYIEHPLLIYGTKFDMRQWFLVTDWNPVTIWYYKDCYLRFSSQAFSLDNLDTAIHLCNNSIQKHFVASSSRHPLVPRDNMWSSNQFKEYLNKNGFENIWDDIISPGMKKAIVNTMQVMQDIVKPRKNSFELYGADFLLGEDFKPWLIEINCSPTMSPSTPVTATLCSNVQEDTIKVIIDRRTEKTCDTGGFELLYKQCSMAIPLYLGINLLVEGSSIKKPLALIPKSQSNGLRNISQISETVQKIYHGSSNTCGKEKTVDNTNNSSKIKTSSISKHHHKPRNYSSYSRKKAKKLSSPKVLGTSIVKAWDEMQEMKNNIAETTQATETENNTKLDPGDQVEHDYEVPKFSKTEAIKKVNKQRLQPRSKITQMSMSVKHLILPNRQMLRDPLHVNLKCLSLDMLNFKDMQHSRSSPATDANRVRTVHEKSTPLRYSYNSPRLHLKDPNIPQLHITGLQPQFKASSDISNKYIETHKNATSNLFNIKKHLLTSSFPLFHSLHILSLNLCSSFKDESHMETNMDTRFNSDSNPAWTLLLLHTKTRD